MINSIKFNSEKLKCSNFYDPDLNKMGNRISIFSCRCTWYGKPCNISEDFETVITDLGVCYTFNGKKPAVQVTQPGTKN